MDLIVAKVIRAQSIAHREAAKAIATFPPSPMRDISYAREEAMSITLAHIAAMHEIDYANHLAQASKVEADAMMQRTEEATARISRAVEVGCTCRGQTGKACTVEACPYGRWRGQEAADAIKADIAGRIEALAGR